MQSTTPAPARPVHAAPSTASRLATTASLLVRAARPGQWIKNLLVLAAPGAAISLGHPPVLLRSLAGAGIFTLASAGGYLLNDARDAAGDRLHPVKRSRPVASGELSNPVAVAFGSALCLLAVALSAMLTVQFTATIAVYLALTIGYSWGLKRIAVLEIMIVASGFLLRAIAGGVINNIPLSRWFLLVASFGALFLVVGKRRAEQVTMGAAVGEHRSVSAVYPVAWLQQVLTLSLTATVLGYCLWAFQLGDDVFHSLVALSTVPFTAAMLRYALLVNQGDGERPERLLLRDPFLIVSVMTCGVLLFISLYLG